jgi:hypothetical protein
VTITWSIGGRQVTETPLEGSRICGVEGRRAQRVELARGALQALGMDQPNVNANASRPGSRNSISNSRSEMGLGCRIN